MLFQIVSCTELCDLVHGVTSKYVNISRFLI